MKLSGKGYAFLGKEEGCKLQAYQDIAGVWTIGYGNTFYEDGTKVKQGDKITKERALQLFKSIVKQFEDGVNATIKRELNANQFELPSELSGKKITIIRKTDNINVPEYVVGYLEVTVTANSPMYGYCDLLIE